MTLVFEYLFFYSLYLFSKLVCSKCKPHFLAENLRKSLVVNVGSNHFNFRIHTFIDSYCQQVLVADNFKRPFLAHVSHKISKLIVLLVYFACITKVNKKKVAVKLQQYSYDEYR